MDDGTVEVRDAIIEWTRRSVERTCSLPFVDRGTRHLGRIARGAVEMDGQSVERRMERSTKALR